MNSLNKVVTLDQLASIVADLKSQGKKIVTTNGAFDILHVGHKRALEASRALGDVLIVGVNSDSSVRQYKSDLRPIVPEADRTEMLSALGCVDFVTIFNEVDPRNFLEFIKPHIHTKSGDYKVEDLLETSTVEKNGGKVVIIPFVNGKSSTDLIKRIQDAYKNE